MVFGSHFIAEDFYMQKVHFHNSTGTGIHFLIFLDVFFYVCSLVVLHSKSVKKKSINFNTRNGA